MGQSSSLGCVVIWIGCDTQAKPGILGQWNCHRFPVLAVRVCLGGRSRMGVLTKPVSDSCQSSILSSSGDFSPRKQSPTL